MHVDGSHPGSLFSKLVFSVPVISRCLIFLFRNNHKDSIKKDLQINFLEFKIKKITGEDVQYEENELYVLNKY